MTIETGDTLPDATLLTIGPDGPAPVSMAEKTSGRKVAIFGVPGAYTGTCTNAHVPSFIRSMDALKDKGVDEVICVSVNDPFVMDAWGDSTGAKSAGISMLGDADGSFTKAIGMDWTAAGAGFFGRSRRYSMLVEDGKVTILNPESGPGECDISAGETLVSQI